MVVRVEIVGVESTQDDKPRDRVDILFGGDLNQAGVAVDVSPRKIDVGLLSCLDLPSSQEARVTADVPPVKDLTHAVWYSITAGLTA